MKYLPTFLMIVAVVGAIYAVMPLLKRLINNPAYSNTAQSTPGTEVWSEDQLSALSWGGGPYR